MRFYHEPATIRCMSAASASEAGIKQQINYFVQVEEGLLGQYRQLRRVPTDVSGQLIADGLAEGARAIVSDIFSSAAVGRKGPSHIIHRFFPAHSLDLSTRV